MRTWVVWAVFALVAGALPAQAQLQDLVAAAEGLRIPAERRVTLDLRRAPAGEAVAKLREAAQLSLRCAPALEARKVTLVARDRPAQGVAEGLAVTLSARWRREGDGFVLKPCEPYEALDPADLLTLARFALTPSGEPLEPILSLEQPQDRVPAGLFPPAQLQALQGSEGIAGAQLTPEQRRTLTGLLRLRARLSLGGYWSWLRPHPDLETARVRLYNRPGIGELLLLEGDGVDTGVELDGTLSPIRVHH